MSRWIFGKGARISASGKIQPLNVAQVSKPGHIKIVMPLSDLEIFYSKSYKFGASQAASNEQCQNRSIAFASEAISPGGSSSKVLDCSTVSQLSIRTPNRFAPLTRPIPAASSGLRRPVSAVSWASRRNSRQAHVDGRGHVHAGFR
jgi:hypothetical protein